MKRSDRIFAIELRNRGRVRHGTATVWRLGGDPRSDQAATCGCQHFAEVHVADHSSLARGRARLGDVQGYQTTFGGGEARAHEITLDEALP
jgi:hypothetical protein